MQLRCISLTLLSVRLHALDMNNGSQIPAVSMPLSGQTVLPIPEVAIHSDLSFDTNGQQTDSLQTRANAELRTAKIMIVDDDSIMIRVIRRMLSAEGYVNFSSTTDSRKLVEQIDSYQPDVVLLDIMMPHQTGIDILRIRKQRDFLLNIPFIILSANSEKAVKREALTLGATEFLAKPVDPVDLAIRVQNSLIVKQHQNHLTDYATQLEKEVEQRTKQIDTTCEQVIHSLARAAEYRDNDTGAHVIRVGKYAAVLAAELGFDPGYCRQIELAAQLHDVGKIGIPDSILLKPGKLTKEEFRSMKQHCQLGCHIIEPLANNNLKDPARMVRRRGFSNIDAPMIALAANIALTHHEKWDGTGYPVGLKAEQIPIEGRITCVADVYDALNSKRPYKPRFSHEKCLEIMLAERGTRFDPAILDIFFEKLDLIRQIADQHPDVV